MPPKTRFFLFVCSIACLTAITTAQSKATIDEALQQLRAGDPFRAVLTLNEVISQSPGDAASVARAQSIRASAFLQMEQPERAKAAVDLALKADPDYAPNTAEVTAATLSLFAAARAPAPANPESAAQAAEKAGQFQQAFLSYLAAYQALPTPAPSAEELRLRERIIRVVQRLGTPPIVPQPALEHARKADQLLEAEAVLGGAAGASSQSAANELTLALRIAPWWPEAMFKLATVQQKLQRVDAALANLNLYKLADPAGYAAAAGARTAAPAAAPVAGAAVPAAGKRATVIIYRLSAFTARATHLDIDCNGQRMTDISNNRYFTFTAPAAKVKLKFEGDDAIEVDLSAGGEHYFLSRPGSFNFNTKYLPAAEVKRLMTEKEAQPSEADRIKSTECKG